MSHLSQTSRSSFTCAFSHDNFTQSYFRIRAVQQQQQDVLTCNWMRKLYRCVPICLWDHQHHEPLSTQDYSNHLIRFNHSSFIVDYYTALD